jgi:hypothetical protein
MINATALQIPNLESTFTELFSILKTHEAPAEESPVLPHSTKKIKIIYQHAENAINLLLQGLQNVGQLIGAKKRGTLSNSDINNLGFFIAAICNLTEALNVLRLDADYILKERGEIDY